MDGGDHRLLADGRQIQRALVREKGRDGQAHGATFEPDLGLLDRRQAAQDDEVSVVAGRERSTIASRTWSSPSVYEASNPSILAG